MTAGTGRWLGRAGLAIAFVVSVLVLAALGVRVMYTTRLGFIVADAIPKGAWQWLDVWYENRYGTPDGESAQDTEVIGLGLVSLSVSLLIVTTATFLLWPRSTRPS